ncbi:hypothetical protein [Phaeobacter sp. HF9A]|uniref:hypothetical protein n=1 Tax=Phaeobacter sp. HF9A TaxID=2721561 RepID=UPI001430BE6A|nr:hypothetical protein [Phaeobacter sp. HF9A]NIZ14229.1 hypothetical protein [Phaeobacter sp. HF9A]
MAGEREEAAFGFLQANVGFCAAKRFALLQVQYKYLHMTIVDLCLLTETTIVWMTREMAFERVPVTGEFVRIDAGGLLPQVVTEVVHDVDGSARVVLGVTRNPEGKVDFWETEADLADDVSELQNEGWRLASKKPNTVWKK